MDESAYPQSDKPSPFVIWIMSDDKPGHVQQAIGLTRALQAIISAEVVTLSVSAFFMSWRDWLLRRTCLGRYLPKPHLILGVGHRTHAAMLAARVIHRGRAIVLMKPSVPVCLFDLAIIPEHDSPRMHPKIIATRGALNVMRPSTRQRDDQGLILIGGPSRRRGWSDELLLHQVRDIIDHSPAVSWKLSTSRRTPTKTEELLRTLSAGNLQVLPPQHNTPDWLSNHLGRSRWVWVSEDSISMVYEALTAGASVGLLEVPPRRFVRDQRLRHLIDDEWIHTFSKWKVSGMQLPPGKRLCEADRCAQLIVQHWLPRWGLSYVARGPGIAPPTTAKGKRMRVRAS